LAHSASLHSSPNPAFIDEQLRVGVMGLAAGELAILRATTFDDESRRWTSEARFVTDASGSIDMASQESLGGTYRGVSPMGLFWSMRLDESHAHGRTTFVKKNTSANRVSVDVELNGRIVASAEVERRYLALGTLTRDLTLPGEPGTKVEHTVGRLYLPAAAESRRPPPVVVILGGSGGGFDLDKAALLARHGFATLALAYFGVPLLPTWLHRIPLEYFEAAFAWLAAQPELDAQRTAVLGVSRGAELALLLGSRLPQIRAIVAYAPSNVAWAASGRDKETGELIPSWTHGGEAVPFLPLPLRQFIFRSALPVALLKRPVMFRNLFRAGLRNSKAVAIADIPVERIRGPILLVSGGDDHLWPAGEMSERIVARLKKRGFAHGVEHLHYPKAGHMLRYPYLPTTARDSRDPHLRNARYSFGGTPLADAEAQADSWRRAIEFLRSSLG
jgi:dienelactone hydrolase